MGFWTFKRQYSAQLFCASCQYESVCFLIKVSFIEDEQQRATVLPDLTPEERRLPVIGGLSPPNLSTIGSNKLSY